MFSSNLFSDRDKAFKKFYEKTGILITDEPINDHPSEIDDELNELYELIYEKPIKALPRLEKLVKKYPKIPRIKNYLIKSYLAAGREKQADRLVDQLLRQHPNYIFGIVDKIMSLKTREELEKFGHLLGKPRDIRTLSPDRGVYHISEFLAYQAAAAYYETMTGEEDSALQRLDTLIELQYDKRELNEVAQKIAFARMANMGNRLARERKNRISVESRPKVFYEPSEEPPTLENPGLSIFYQTGLKKISEEKIAEFMQLPRESLIRDLERILEDSIRRREYYETMDYSEDTHEFLIHSLYFLGALEAKESLQKVLDLLRMGAGFTEYWFGDEMKRFLFPTLYILGKNQLEALKDYALEPDLFAYDRIDVAQVAAQVALHEPERRAEVVNWFEDIYTYLLDRERDKRLIDSDFIGLSVGYVLDFRGVELLPLIGKLWEKGWISSSMQGDLADITEEMQGSLEADRLEPIPENITEFYNGEYKKRKAAPTLSPKGLSFREKITNPSPAEELIMEQWIKVFSSPFSGEFPIDDYDEEDDYYDEEEILPYSPPVVRTPRIKAKAKIGRNDPCPCGSGKKYKRCCWGKN